MWEKRIVHEGLNAFRVIRGYTQEEVETKARLQLAAWAERWQRKQELEITHRRQMQRRSQWEQQSETDKRNRSLALNRTLEAEKAVAGVGNLLSSILSERKAFDWAKLRDLSEFSEPEPQKPTPKPIPQPPRPDEFLPVSPPPAHTDNRTLSFLAGRSAKLLIEFIVPTIKRRRLQGEFDEVARRKAVADRAFSVAHCEWQKLADEIKLKNHTAQSNYESAMRSWNEDKIRFLQQQQSFNSAVDAFRTEYLTRSPDALVRYWTEVLDGSEYPDSFPRDYKFHFQPDSGMVVVDYELPNHKALPRVKSVKYVASRAEFQEVPLSEVDFKRLYDDALYQICLRTLHELFATDEVGAITIIVFNGWVHSTDKATGNDFHACIMSVQVGKEEFSAINLGEIDLKACFRKLKGISGGKLIDQCPVKPILTLNMDDPRFVPAHDVAETLDNKTNLAAMDWLDFENLIRELFEKEFSQNGGEVKITQASHDGGVDAIAFDPDPIRGGKIVIQAKRYTNTVGVAAVRDLFGTVHNEGATKGILVTTSDYGPDAYEFAKDKPLTLLSGSELLYLLGKHGYQAKIDLKEAKAILGEAVK